MPELTTADTSAVVTGLLGWTEYRVRVRAVNAAGEGAWSGWVEVTAEGVTLPLPPPVLEVERREPVTVAVPVGRG